MVGVLLRTASCDDLLTTLVIHLRDLLEMLHGAVCGHLLLPFSVQSAVRQHVPHHLLLVGHEFVLETNVKVHCCTIISRLFERVLGYNDEGNLRHCQPRLGASATVDHGLLFAAHYLDLTDWLIDCIRRRNGHFVES